MAYASCETPGLASTWLMPGDCAVASVDVAPSLAPAGTARILTAQAVDPAGIAWSRDGKSILFVGEGSSSVNLWRLWVDRRREPETVELAGGHAEHPATAISRDRLVFSRYDWEGHLYRFAPGKPLERVAAPSSSEGDPHFSPDGRRIAFASGRSGEFAIWVAAADGSDPRQLTSHQWIWQGSPNWSPNGQTIAFDAHDPDGHVHIWTIPAKAARPGESRSRRAIRPCRRGLATARGSTSRRRGRAAATSGACPRAAVRRSKSPEPAPGSSRMKPLMERPADQLKYGDSPLMVMPLKGAGPPRRLIECVRHASFIPVGTMIFYAGCEPGTTPSLHSIDMVRGRDHVLGRLEHFPADPLGHPRPSRPIERQYCSQD